MSAGDDPSDTLPPPAGEEDAYSATTKVGVMPAELMAKLRAEGLIPDESEERRARAGRPSAKHTLRSLPAASQTSGDSSPPPASSGDAKTVTTAPPPPPEEATLVRRNPPSERQQAAAPAPADADADAPVVEVTSELSEADYDGEKTPPPPLRAPRGVVETPIAFASPPSTSDASTAGAELSVASDDVQDDRARALKARSKTDRVVFVVGALVALAVIAFVMALLSRGR